MKNLLITTIFFLGIFSFCFSQNKVSIYEKGINIPTYLVESPDKVPVFYTGRAYQGAQGRVYPYAFNGNLTDEDGPYIEIMTGAYSNNQPDYSWADPYFTKEATMHFMPLRGMTHVKESTLESALNFEMTSDNEALVEIHAYGDYPNAKISLSKGEELIWQKTENLHPSQPRKWHVELEGRVSYYDLELKVENQHGSVLGATTPKN